MLNMKLIGFLLLPLHCNEFRIIDIQRPLEFVNFIRRYPPTVNLLAESRECFYRLFIYSPLNVSPYVEVN